MGKPNPTNFSAASIPDLSGKTYIVTGGNTGIGYETCLELCRKNARVVMASRSAERANAAIDTIKKQVPTANIEFLELRLDSLKQVRDAADTFIKKDVALDCLINNAGIMAPPFTLTADGIESQFGTNHVGHFEFTRKLIPALLRAESPRIVNLSSSYHDKAPNPEGIRFDRLNDPNATTTWERYGQSKLANILFSKSLHKKFGDKIYVNSVHPGFVNTELTRGPVSSYGIIAAPFINLSKALFALTPQNGALTQLYVATSPDIVKNNIKDHYFVPIANDAPSELTEFGKDEKLAEKLWVFTENLIKEKIGE